ncbi:MAG TPA: cysteine rich repeat-containing protein [Roseiarcus sp.]|nr:cysteine rich repeat-containing protein [Roseiarcus sp.]
MPIRAAILIAIVFAVAPMASGPAKAQNMGTPEQRTACAPDVRRFCYKVKESDGQDAYLQCLELHRDHLSQRCVTMLQSYGK